jgi:hypothetical protein
LDNGNFTYPLGNGWINLEPMQGEKLAELLYSPAHDVLMEVLASMQQAAEVGLRNPDLTIDQIRVEQGKVVALGDLAEVIGPSLRSWYDQSKSNADTEA